MTKCVVCLTQCTDEWMDVEEFCVLPLTAVNRIAVQAASALVTGSHGLINAEIRAHLPEFYMSDSDLVSVAFYDTLPEKMLIQGQCFDAEHKIIDIDLNDIAADAVYARFRTDADLTFRSYGVVHGEVAEAVWLPVSIFEK